MYSFRFTLSADLRQVSLLNRQTIYKGLSQNPYARAKKTNIPLIGEYYVNSGRLCILFDIDDTDNVIIIYGIVRSEYLHKIITGRISI
jgi:hypothetical protein